MKKDKLITTITDSEGNDWSVTSKAVYESILENVPLFQRLKPDESEALMDNIAGQLQFLEFTEVLFKKLEFHPERPLLYDERTGDTFWQANEIEGVLFKQILLSVASIVEAICYVLLRGNDVKLEKSTRFKDLIKLAEENSLIDKFESDILHEIRGLRNEVHLQEKTISNSELFSQNELDNARCCLYWLLLRLLKIDENIMNVHFSFLPRCVKEELDFHFSQSNFDPFEHLKPLN